jgi:hypothetical protein
MLKLMCATVVVSGLVALAAVAPAHADPANKGQPVTLECDDGVTYDTVFKGIGAWVPVQDTASNKVFIPRSFTDQSFTVTDAAGNVINEGAGPDLVKRNADKERGTSLVCVYTLSNTFEDPDLGPLTFVATGTVAGFTTPAN